MSKKQKYILLIILTIICGTIVFKQYQKQKYKHKRLLSVGQKAKIISKYNSSWGVGSVSYYFVTQQGQRIEGGNKCGKTSYEQYTNATAIYNPTIPTEYEFSFDFESYYPTWRIIFFFFMYLPVMIFVTYGFINSGVRVYLKLKDRF